MNSTFRTSQYLPEKQSKLIPTNWRWVKLEDLAKLQSGGTPLRGNAQYYGGTIPWAKIQDLTNSGKWISSTEEYITEIAIQDSSAQIFPEKTVLFAMYGSIGTCSIAEKPIATNQAILGCVCGDQLLPEYLYFWFSYNKEKFLKMGRGGTQANLNAGIVKSFEIPLPPLEEQKRIAARLDEQMRHIEQARLAAEESLSAARELPSAYLQEVLGSDVSNTWTKTQLGEVLTLRKEVIHPYDNPKGPAVFVGLEHIESNTGIRTGSVEVEMSKLTGRKPKYYKGDIVYGYLRPYLNKVWVAEFNGLCSVDQYVYSVDENKADTDFIAWFMRSPIYLKRAPVNGAPGQLPRIRTEEVASVEINLPPLKEQKKIASQISKKLSTTNELISTLETQLAEIESLPSAVLGQAFAGEI
ncbi:MAG: hypothetical protein HND47_03910 [Chloroflexi bacterium]|nr:hypothetical protein [Chloroflexota bacterium]